MNAHAHATSAGLDSDPQALLRCAHDAVRRGCPGRLRGQREDIAQSLVTRLLQRRESACEVTLTAAYVQTAARHAIADALRTAARRHVFWATNAPIVKLRAEEATPWPDSGCPLLRSAVADQLSALGPQSRHAVILYLEGDQIKEIATKLGWNAKKASNTVFRTLGRVRKQLAAQGFTADALV